MRRKTIIIICIMLLTCFICFDLGRSFTKAEIYQNFEELEKIVENISENPELFYTTDFELIEFNEDKSLVSVTLKCSKGKLLVTFDQNFQVVSMTQLNNKSSSSILNSDWVITIFFLIIFAFVIVIIELRRKSPHDF